MQKQKEMEIQVRVQTQIKRQIKRFHEGLPVSTPHGQYRWLAGVRYLLSLINLANIIINIITIVIIIIILQTPHASLDKRCQCHHHQRLVGWILKWKHRNENCFFALVPANDLSL